MRLLSLGIIFALLFSTYVTAVPVNDGANQPPVESTSAAPEASGSGGGGFNWDDIDTSHKGWGWIKTGNQVRIKLPCIICLVFDVLFTRPGCKK